MKTRGPEASKWDFDAWQTKTVDYVAIQRAFRYYRMILNSAILPRPHESGRSYEKPTWYLAVALIESGLSKQELKDRLLPTRKSELEIFSDCSSSFTNVLTKSSCRDRQDCRWFYCGNYKHHDAWKESGRMGRNYEEKCDNGGDSFVRHQLIKKIQNWSYPLP